ncbi:MAG: FtsW/RodA/SpoVE family cell cycle protein, partial [Candidatus Nomurabacteria bacterium]|jgi:cell division protein FtsW|nr:FtsW/RodA/SpoVE family cell cycle protein [Candidatus Nomurabacteria bacterium]
LFLSLFVIVIMQKDLGTGVALIAIVLSQLVIAGVSGRKLFAIVAVIVALGVMSILVAPHRLARMATFLGDGSEAGNYHIEQAAIALGSGGFFGRGLGQSIQAFGWLPMAIHDSIFAIIGEMFGFFGVIILILLIAFLLKRIIDKVDFLENAYLRLIVAGVFGWLAAHVVLNIGAMTHIIPLTGITLPLVSFGGTSMLFIMSGLGLVFGVSRYTVHRKIKEQEGGDHENPLRGRRVGRSYYANRSGR